MFFRRISPLLPHFLALGWAAGIGFLLWNQTAGISWQDALQQILIFAVTGLVGGYLSVFFLKKICRGAGRIPIGPVCGYFLLTPPAIVLGYSAGSLAQGFLGQLFGGAPVAFVAAAALVGAAVLAIGSLLGLPLQYILSGVWHRLPASVTRPRLRPTPRVRIAMLSALLVAVSGYALQEHFGLPGFLNAQAADDTPQASVWQEKEKHLYREMLAASKHEILVVPMQAQHRSVDRASRSLMTRMIVSAVEQRLGQPLPDPTWVSRAFGSSMRTVKDEDILSLAEAVDARRVVVSQVALDEGTLAMHIKVEVREKQSVGWRITARKTIGPVAFDDKTPPAVAFQGVLPDIADLLPRAAVSKAAIASALPLAAQLPEDPASLFAPAATSPLEAALRLQLVASLHEAKAIEGEHLFERSLIALASADPGDPLVKLLAARAYFHLHHRPYAVELLGAAQTPEAMAFRGILQGNLSQAEKSIDAIANQALQIIARIEAEDLRSAYGKLGGFEKRRELVFSALPAYAHLFSLRFSAGDWFSPETTQIVIQALDRIGVPVSSLATRDPLAGTWSFIKGLYFIYDDIDDAAAPLLEAAYPETMRRLAGPASPADARLAGWDQIDLLFAINRYAYIKSIDSTVLKQALPERALAMKEASKDIFEGHPRLAYLEVIALNMLADKADERQRQQLLERRSRIALNLYRWEGGESEIGPWLEWAIWPRSFQKYLDEPLRPYRSWRTQSAQLEFHNNMPWAVAERRVTELQRKLAFATTEFELVEEAEKLLNDLGRPADFAAVLAATAGRFVGSHERSRYLTRRLEGIGDRAERKHMLQGMLAEEPDTWLHYFLLGKVQGEEGNYREAQKTFLSYPAFTTGNANPVGLSNEAAQAGIWLYDHGEIELSRPLFRLSSGYKTGSGSGMVSAELLAVADGNWHEAIAQARLNLERYNQSAAASHYLSYLFLVGKDREAWAQFGELQPRYQDEEMWWAALTGHRLAATSAASLKTWLVAQGDRDRHRNYLSRAQRERFAFIALTMDRKPAAETVATLQAITAQNNQSDYYPTIARGYQALRQGDFKAAIAALEPTSRTLTDISAQRRQTLNDLLPYVAYAYAHSGRAADFEIRLKQYADKVGKDFDYLLAHAVLDGIGGRHDEALEKLETAYVRYPASQTRSFVPVYELLELTEWLLRDTGHAAYRSHLLDWARREQRSWPNSWAYSFEAKHADNATDRTRALAMTLFLDPEAERIRDLDDRERGIAKSWLANNNPFRLPGTKRN